MKFIYNKLFITGILLAALTSCSKFDAINSNPDTSNTANPEWLATSILGSITVSDISSQKSFIQPFLLSKYMIWKEGGPESFQYNRFGRANFNRMTPLRNIAPMIANATTEELKNSYTAFGHFARAWQFFQMTMQVGDIPYTEAIKGESEKIPNRSMIHKRMFLLVF
ncbi:SusD/RagB family nutrient-binding outer membrane lipoprotein [Niabella hibiscisoli]|uniref:SusD/RagB family nutrient-binding outer membrane lipoprotein n=1 Tax=Niabella hibiscisoli TaxID=1825928 RepID=UPI0021D3F64D|nr:SusD/RagB family nutrient-binding outer membrane lipoprotein [Niabella hibiscisoli]